MWAAVGRTFFEFAIFIFIVICKAARLIANLAGGCGNVVQTHISSRMDEIVSNREKEREKERIPAIQTECAVVIWAEATYDQSQHTTFMTH